ncbi:phosphoglycolate phosphatase [Luteibacter aegosomatissinici]|uniref:phosphoglycolate phosphatase n=1 Tax=Luteibacter aegosomatissinici TaxID=2911539 RepID=UPI001FFB4CD2|nr:phosphoglycolate phosphatase [Luteibacter aegosomatissinici]UPG96638.1 phosphoglycolate phosphatase [Luteibacter aegosomatissinici]
MAYPFSLVIFDLDGTLVDSAADIAESVNRTLSDWRLPTYDVKQITGWIGEGSRQLITYAFRDAGSDADIDDVMPGFLEHYAETALDAVVYPGVADTLAALHAQGVKLAVCTNKNEEFVRPLLEVRGLLPYIDGIVGGNTLPERKPSGVPLKHLADEAGVPLNQVLMVGDSESDMLAARDAGVPYVLVSYGYPKSLDIRNAGALAVIDQFAELLNLHT